MAVAGLCLAAALAAISCGREQDAGRGGGAAERPGADSVTVYVDIRERGYAALERIPMRLVVRNETRRTLRFAFPTSQRFDFMVKKDKKTVWRWSEGRSFAGSPGRLMLAPGDSLVYEYVWDGRLEDGRPPRLGRYRAAGRLMTEPPIETRERRFGIVD